MTDVIQFHVFLGYILCLFDDSFLPFFLFSVEREDY